MNGYSVPVDGPAVASAATNASSTGVGLLWLLLLALILLYIGFGLIIAYHWFRYARDPHMASLTMLMYSGAGIVLTLTMISALALL